MRRRLLIALVAALCACAPAAAAIREVSNDRRFNLLEALASTIADMLLERFEPESVRLCVRKPQVKPAGLTVEYTAVTVTRP